MKKTILIFALLLTCLNLFGRVRYIKPQFHSFVSPAYVMAGNNVGFMGLGYGVGFGSALFGELNGTISFPGSSIFAPKLFTGRVGYSFQVDSFCIRPFVGFGVMPPVSLEEKRRCLPVYSGGVYVVQNIGKDFHLKYEIAVMNRYVVPSIGMYVTF